MKFKKSFKDFKLNEENLKNMVGKSAKTKDGKKGQILAAAYVEDWRKLLKYGLTSNPKFDYKMSDDDILVAFKYKDGTDVYALGGGVFMENIILESKLNEAADLEKMDLSDIARMIKDDWKKVSPYAKPYLDAMLSLRSINDKYYLDSGSSIVAYFLANANVYKGEVARSIKKELNRRLKSI